ncbi:Y-family DNA polymerase [Vagococcus coleopterorum]|uniref:Y-family DNA polymerase n=1 Tax=Vagococcus coleopterorum TaxID=2714946 RepID=A0A6G8ANN3_9ENTE|nr:Y-family DNA polymerase [Vagococcus coleopterorum]QIL46580.1 Y-family DNA polymerase [Vagococcus coleopterorum]
MKRLDYSEEQRRDVLCIDVKSFFASVESVKHGLHPLKSELVVMSRGDKKGGLVLAASPLVKEKYGLKTGSRKFDFPKYHKIMIVPPRMGLYVKVNQLINQIFQQYAAPEDVHPYSIDEAFIDITNSKHLFGQTTWQVARQIQDHIWRELNLAVAVGIGDNPLLAKLALDNEAKETPSQIAEWHYEDVQEKVWGIPTITDMWGIGNRTAKRLQSLGIYSVYDLSQVDRDLIRNKMGAIGRQLYYHSHGIDRSVISEKEGLVTKSQSIGNSQVLERDYHKKEDIELIIREMTANLSQRLREHKQFTSCVSLQLGFPRQSGERALTRQLKIEPTDTTAVLTNHLLHLYRVNEQRRPLRNISISFSHLGDPVFPQLNLFETSEEQEKNEKLDQVMDQVKEQFGKTALFTANSLKESGTYLKRSRLLGGHQRDIES